jgi:hypothetical protein
MPWQDAPLAEDTAATGTSWQDAPLVDEGAPTEVSPAEVTGFKKLTPFERGFSGPLREAVGQGALYGLGDEAMGFLRSGRMSGPKYEAARNKERQKIASYEKQAPEAGALKLAGAIAPMFIPGVGQINLAGRGAGLLTRAAVEGAVAGGLEGLGTTEDKSNLGDVASNVSFGAGLGAGGGTLAAKYLGPLIAGGVSRVRAMTGSAAKDVIDYLGRVGMTVTPETERYVRRQIANGADPRVVVDAAMAREQGIPLTTGQLTGDAERLAREAALRSGSEGAAARDIMVEQERAAQDAMRGRVEQLGGDIAGTGTAPAPGEGGRAVSERLSTVSEGQRASNRAAYATAEESGRDAVLATGANVSNEMTDAVLRRFTAEDVPQVLREINTLGENAPLSEVYAARRRLSEMRAGVPSMLSNAASQAIEALDSHVVNALDNALVAGDTGAIKLWTDAIGEYKDWAQVFKRGDLTEKLTKRIPGARGEAATVLSVPPQDAANLILGHSKLGFVNKKGLSRDLFRMRNALGETSPEWNALRGEMFMRFGQSATKGADQTFQPAAFTKSWQDFLHTDRELAEMMFSENERRAITQFATLARRTEGGDTRAAAAARNNLSAILGKLNFLKKIPVVGSSLDALAAVKAGQQAAKAVSGELPLSERALRGAQRGLALGTGASTSGQEAPTEKGGKSEDIEAKIARQYGVKVGEGASGVSLLVVDPASGEEVSIEDYLARNQDAAAEDDSNTPPEE